MKTRAIGKKDYEKLLELDKKVCPTDSPVTEDVLKQWYQNNPEFGIIFEEKEIKAMCLVIPLSKTGWEKLISGELLESELNSETIFNNARDKEIGIHIYHIEKLDKSMNQFYKDSLVEINKVIEKLKTENSELKVVGFSALSVSLEGINLFYNKLNFREREFINTEHILTKGNKLEILDTSSKEKLKQKLCEGYEYKNRCKMLVLYPKEPSLVWNYFG